jgi:hypothetical protein
MLERRKNFSFCVTCANCQRQIDDSRARVALMLGEGRAALDWPCFEAMQRPGRAAMLMRLVREATIALRIKGSDADAAPGAKYQDKV